MTHYIAWEIVVGQAVIEVAGATMLGVLLTAAKSALQRETTRPFNIRIIGIIRTFQAVEWDG
jgi:hypothetical protein